MKSLSESGASRRQTGAALITSLLFLTVMTMIGITSMQSVSLEERMNGNMRDRSLAFQAAESALRAAEASLAPGGTLPSFTTEGANGFYTENQANPIGYTLAATWSTPAKVTTYAGTDLASITQPPAYIVEQLSEAPATGSGSGNSGGSLRGDPNDGGDDGTAQTLYRVTARGTGGTPDSVVILQSTYRR